MKTRSTACFSTSGSTSAQAAARSRPLLAVDLHAALLAGDGHDAAGRWRRSSRLRGRQAQPRGQGQRGHSTPARASRAYGRHLRPGLVEPKVCRSSSPNPIAVQNSFFICQESTQYPASTFLSLLHESSSPAVDSTHRIATSDHESLYISHWRSP